MKLKPLMTYTANLLAGVECGQGPYGNRVIVEVTGGEFSGERLNGKVLSGGGDWLLLDDEGVGHLDVRATFQTDDGANIYVQYYGRLVMGEAEANALAGKGETQFGDTRFFTQPRFETGDSRYAWLNSTIAVAEGRLMPHAVEYRVFECVND